MKILFEMNSNGVMEFVETAACNSPVYIDFENGTVCVPYDGKLTISEFSEIVTTAFYNCFFRQFEKQWSESTIKTRDYAGIEYGISGDMPYKEVEYVLGRDFNALWHIYCEL